MSRHEHLPEIDAVVPIEEVDAAIADRLLPHAQAGAVRALGAFGDLSDQEPLYAAGAAVLATGAVMRHGETWRMGTRIIAAHLLATALRGMVKASVDRTRPDAAVRRGRYVAGKGRHRSSDFNSFPSGHTAGAVAVALAVGRHHPAAARPALAIAGLQGAAQVARSRHFLSDIIAGAAIGWAAEAMIDALIRRAARV